MCKLILGVILAVCSMHSCVFGQDGATAKAVPCCKNGNHVFQMYPAEISLGDTVYFRVIFDNSDGVESNSVSMPEYSSDEPEQVARVFLLDGTRSWPFLRESVDYMTINPEGFGMSRVVPAGEKAEIYLRFVQMPPLEDLKFPFWQAMISDIPEDGRDLILKCELPTNDVEFQVPLRIVPASDTRLQLMNKWYDATPEPWLPYYEYRNGRLIPWKIDIDASFTSSEKEDMYKFHRKRGNLGSHRFRVSPESLGIPCNMINIQQHQIAPGAIRKARDRLPGDPNCPETWEGWKELEELLEPSTMRDEIRLTRMMIQYCDTEDPAVLDELTEWFSGMNEIQRAVMAENVRWLPGNFSDKDFYESMIKIRETLRPFAPAMTTTLSHI